MFILKLIDYLIEKMCYTNMCEILPRIVEFTRYIIVKLILY